MTWSPWPSSSTIETAYTCNVVRNSVARPNTCPLSFGPASRAGRAVSMTIQPTRGIDSTKRTEHNVQNAALLGASSAFGRTASLPVPSTPGGARGNGALVAANLAGKKSPIATSRSPSASSISSLEFRHLRAQTTGSSTPQLPSPSSSLLGGSPLLLEVPPNTGAASRSPSPSNIAATLAAARHQNKVNASRPASPARSIPFDLIERPRIFRGWSSEVPLVGMTKSPTTMEGSRRTSQSADRPTDETPIPSTTSLVKLFEQGRRDSADGDSQPLTARRASVGQSPKPEPKPKPKPKPGVKPPAISSERLNRHETEPSTTPKEAGAAAPLRGRPPSREPSGQRPSSVSDVRQSLIATGSRSKPELPPPRRTGKKTENDQDPVKSPPPKIRPKPPPPKQPRRSSSNPVLVENNNRSSLAPPRTQYQQQSIRQISPHMTGDSLANAIVGANLASRGPSQSRSSTPAPTRRSSRKNHYHDEQNPLSRLRSRSNSPAKPGARQKPVQLRTTMRKEAAESSSDEGRGKYGRGRKHYMRKHPNKHREGSRKRWRDRLTEAERKRYEGVWSTNRNKALAQQVGRGSIEAEDDVLDLVVRDIWSRSRLPASVLGEIWDLVDRRRVRRLTREEFVVGLWLIDQSLKGRKVPARVMESVWASVRLMGVKVKSKNFQ